MPIVLPEALQGHTQIQNHLYSYQSAKDLDKQQISLTKNVFSFLLAGQKQVLTQNGTLSIQNSHFMLMKAGHCLMTEKIPASRQYYQSILLFFTDDMLSTFVKHHGIALRTTPQAPTAFAFAYTPYVKRFVEGLAELSQLPEAVQQTLVPLKFEDIMLYLCETQGVDFVSALVSQHSSATQKFMATVESNTLNKMSLSELAFLANMSLSTFKRHFKKHFGEPPRQWFLNKRLEHAAFLLKHKNKRASEIYDELGFENPSNFSHSFKAKYGVTPKQFKMHNGLS